VSQQISRLIELIFCRKGVDRVYGLVDRIHGVPAHRSTDHIKGWPLILSPTARIKKPKGYFFDIIYTIESRMDGPPRLRPMAAAACDRRPWDSGSTITLVSARDLGLHHMELSPVPSHGTTETWRARWTDL
jgi:hypothetical protein